jgi:hypothetical protein
LQRYLFFINIINGIDNNPNKILVNLNQEIITELLRIEYKFPLKNFLQDKTFSFPNKNKLSSIRSLIIFFFKFK